MSTIVERIRAGEIPDDQIDDAIDDEIDAWHARTCDCNAGWGSYAKGSGPDPARCPVHGEGKVHLHEYLGMTHDEFARWVRDPSYITRIKESHP